MYVHGFFPLHPPDWTCELTHFHAGSVVEMDVLVSDTVNCWFATDSEVGHTPPVGVPV